MNNKQLAKYFSMGKAKGKSLNMFIDNDTIYYYGYHFPIARRYKGFILFNTKGYSNTTAKHKNEVLSFLNDDDVVYLMNCDVNKITSEIVNNLRVISELEDKLKRCRTENSKNSIERMITTLNENIKRLELINKMKE